jgi:hypothetical protein
MSHGNERKEIMLKMKWLTAAILLGAFPAPWASAFGADAKLWPEPLPLKQSIAFSNTGQFAAGLYIFGVDGNPRYLIECHDSRYKEDKGFLYSGDFECRLTPLYEKTPYSTLFTDDLNQSRDWQSRARFLSQELVGKCASYPEYGAVRHLRLRGMEITLGIHDISLGATDLEKQSVKGRPRLLSFRFDIEVVPAPAVKSGIAEATRYRRPPHVHPDAKDDLTLDCSTVLRE